VRYTIAAAQTWSNGVPFTASDLWRGGSGPIALECDERRLRSIKTFIASPDGLVVTAVFATPYADWNLLFRDVEATAPRAAVRSTT